MTAIVRLTRAEPHEPTARPAPAKRGDGPRLSFRDELDQTTEASTPVRGRTPIKRVTIPPGPAPALVGDPTLATAVTPVPNVTLPSAPTVGLPPVVAGIAAASAPKVGPAIGVAAVADPAPAAPAAAALVPPPPTLTPLEQAVQALLEQLQPAGAASEEEEASPLELPVDPGATHAGPVPARLASDGHRAHAVSPATATAPEPAAEPVANPSHVHLVMDDGDERVVVTVAVRGNEVRVAMRANDDTTVAALARNAGSLDHALRARGLDLTDFTAPDRERERADREPHDPPPERPHPRAPRFRLEDNA